MRTNINPGKLKHPITIQKTGSTQNEFGEEVSSWTEFKRAWAEIKPIKASEFFAGFKDTHEITHRVIIRYICDLKPKMRIVHRGRVFEIKGIRDFFENNTHLEIMCKEVFDV